MTVQRIALRLLPLPYHCDMRQRLAEIGKRLPPASFKECGVLRYSPHGTAITRTGAQLADALLALAIDKQLQRSHTMSLISGLSALTYPLTSALSSTSAAKTKSSVGDAFQNVLANQTGTQPSSLTQSAVPATKSTADEFQQYMAMSPAEKMRYSVMSDMNITQAQLDAMPADQRALVEKKIEDVMKLREELQTAQTAAGGQQSQAATGLSLLKQVQAGQKPQPSVDVFS